MVRLIKRHHEGKTALFCARNVLFKIEEVLDLLVYREDIKTAKPIP